MKACLKLQDRALIAVGSSEAQAFLQGILTCNLDSIEEQSAGFGGLLTPQGKILFDFFVVRRPRDYLLDVASEMVEDLMRRLMFYRLRADVSLEIVDNLNIFALWGDDVLPATRDLMVADPRHKKLGWRQYSNKMPAGVDVAKKEDFDMHRVIIGVPEGGVDYEYGKAFPHEALYDQTGGVDFAKGCYVGQEVISRMHHRSTARKRVIKITAPGMLPASGTVINADGKSVGEIKSRAGKDGLALLRLDRVRDAMDDRHELTAEGISITPKIQDWASFGWPSKK